MFKTMTLALAGLGLTLAACGGSTAAKEPPADASDIPVAGQIIDVIEDAPTTTVSATIDVHYSMSVYGETCASIENTYDDDWGYDDVPNMELQVRDEDHVVIGHGALPLSGTDDGYSCVFSTTISDVERSDLYQVGNDNRGYVTWDAGDVAGTVLVADASLGS